MVLDAVTEQPVEGAEVFVYFENDGPNSHQLIQGFATTGRDGRFHVPSTTRSPFGPWLGWEGPGLIVFHSEYGLGVARNVPDNIFKLKKREASLELVERRHYSAFLSVVWSSKPAAERMCAVVFGPGASCDGIEAER